MFKTFLKIFELHCEQCDCPICALCISSFSHEQHFKVDIFAKFEEKRAILQRDLQELENHIYPTYRDIDSEISIQRKKLNKKSQELKAVINKQGDNLHRAINSAIKKMKTDVDHMDMNYRCFLKKREDEITRSISEIKQNMSNMKKLLDSYDVCQVCSYKSKSMEFRRLHYKFIVSLPQFVSHQIDEAEIKQQLGVLLELRIKTEIYDSNSTSVEAVSTVPKRPLIMCPHIITDVFTNFENTNKEFHIPCAIDREIWTCGYDDFLRFYSLDGKLKKLIQTKSEKVPFGLAIIRFGDLIYADKFDRSLNIVKGTEVHTILRFQGWRPLGLCSTPSDEILLLMVNDSNDQTKIVRYSDFIEKQNIQFDDKGQPLYSSNGSYNFPTCICENSNRDICVADYHANAVVVVNQNGELRFRYTTSQRSFQPCGIATDSQSRILTSECSNDLIHILNQDGQLLCYLDDDSFDLHCPWGLYVDNDDTLFVAERDTGRLKSIQYCSL